MSERLRATRSNGSTRRPIPLPGDADASPANLCEPPVHPTGVIPPEVPLPLDVPQDGCWIDWSGTADALDVRELVEATADDVLSGGADACDPDSKSRGVSFLNHTRRGEKKGAGFGRLVRG